MKNWKTTLLGLAGAIFTACMPLLQNGTFDLQKDWEVLVMAAGIFLFGLNSKDNNVTGGTKQI